LSVIPTAQILWGTENEEEENRDFFRAGGLKEHTLVYISEDESGGLEKLLAIEEVKSRGQSNQRPDVTFRSGARFHRRAGMFNGKKAWMLRLDGEALRELADRHRALEANRLETLKLNSL